MAADRAARLRAEARAADAEAQRLSRSGLEGPRVDARVQQLSTDAIWLRAAADAAEREGVR